MVKKDEKEKTSLKRLTGVERRFFIRILYVVQLMVNVFFSSKILKAPRTEVGKNWWEKFFDRYFTKRWKNGFT